MNRKRECLHLYEEVLLLAPHNQRGTVASGTMAPYALGGALLAELALCGRVRVERDSQQRLVELVAACSRFANCSGMHAVGQAVGERLVGDGGYDIRTVQELLGHNDVRTTIYTHVLNRSGRGVRSPPDGLAHRSPMRARQGRPITQEEA